MKTYHLAIIAAAALAAGCNSNVKTASQDFNSLPPAVQKTVRAQAPNSEITDIDKTTQNGRDVYKVQFRSDNGNKPTVVVATDGQLISSDLPNPPGAVQKLLTPTGSVGTPFSALPLPVQKTIKSHAPNAQIADIERHDENGRVIYEVEFKEQGVNPSIRVAEDGTLVQDLQK